RSDLSRIRGQPRHRPLLPELRGRDRLAPGRLRPARRSADARLRRRRARRLRRAASFRRRRRRQRLRDEASLRAPRVSPLRPRPPARPGAARRSASRRLFGNAAGHPRRHGGGARALRLARLRRGATLLLQPHPGRALPEGGTQMTDVAEPDASTVATDRAAARAPFELRSGALRLAVRADFGGAIAGLWHSGTPILRSTEPARLASAHESAMFPLVPYSNRLGYRRFRWRGKDYSTRANVAASPHSLHGLGWQRPWAIVSSSALEVVLELRHEGDADWPFAFTARQYLALDAASFSARLQLSNDAEIEQPVGLGWHPYFVRRSRSRIHIELSNRWDADAT